MLHRDRVWGQTSSEAWSCLCYLPGALSSLSLPLPQLTCFPLSITVFYSLTRSPISSSHMPHISDPLPTLAVHLPPSAPLYLCPSSFHLPLYLTCLSHVSLVRPPHHSPRFPTLLFSPMTCIYFPLFADTLPPAASWSVSLSLHHVPHFYLSAWDGAVPRIREIPNGHCHLWAARPNCGPQSGPHTSHMDAKPDLLVTRTYTA